MAVYDLWRKQTVEAVALTTAATDAPVAADDGYLLSRGDKVRAFFKYAGTVSSCNATLWFLDPIADVWYKGVSTDDEDALAPGGASAVNEARDFDVGQHSIIFVQIAAIAGGGSVTVKLAGLGPW